MRIQPKIVEEDTGGKLSFEFSAYCPDQQARCGYIQATRKVLRGRVVYYVTNVDVQTPFRRKGVATKLYEAAAKEACRRRGRLASLERNPGAFSNNFWEKQRYKGRAEIVKQRGKPPAFVLDCPITSLDGNRLRGR